MLSILSETQQAIVETVTMRLHVLQALQYLKDAGHEMSRAKYFRQKKKIENMALDRMHHIAKVAYKEQHLERLDRLELAEKLMWDNYFMEKDPSKRVKILESIIGIQPYVSGYYDSTRYVLEETIKADEDLHRNKRPYVGIDVAESRKREFEKEAQERRFQMYKEREGEASKPSPYINIHTVMPEYQDKIIPMVICECTAGNEGHYACYKCHQAFCGPGPKMIKEPVKCPRCNVVVYDPHTDWFPVQEEDQREIDSES